MGRIIGLTFDGRKATGKPAGRKSSAGKSLGSTGGRAACGNESRNLNAGATREVADKEDKCHAGTAETKAVADGK